MKGIYLLLITIIFTGCAKNTNIKETSSEKYFGLEEAGDTSKLFATGIVSDALANRDVAITPDGKEIYWCVRIATAGVNAIVYSRFEKGKWSNPAVVPNLTNTAYNYLEPNITSDGKKMFFFSDMPDTLSGEETGDSDIWVMDRIGEGWGNPYNLDGPVNSDAPEFFPSLAKNSTIYFSRADPNTRVHFIYKSEYIDGKYIEPELLPAEVNSGRNRFNSFVAPDESYIIVPTMGREDTYGGCDYYISFNLGGGKWTMAENMGPEINSDDPREWSPYVSPDGKFFFFMSARLNKKFDDSKVNFENIQKLNNAPQNGNSDIYWISTSIIEKLRAKALKKVEEEI